MKNKYDKFNNIHIYNIALSSKNGPIDFFVSDYSPTNSCLEPNILLYEKLNSSILNDLKASNKIQVESINFDSWYEMNIKDRIIDIMKIDTQGFEYDIIKGGINTLKNKVKLLYFEIQYLDFYKKSTPFWKIYEMLYNNGFYFYCYLSSNKRGKYQFLESDVLFVNQNFIKPYE